MTVVGTTFNQTVLPFTGKEYQLMAGVHELGHAFGYLLDEYWYDATDIAPNDNEAPNRTATILPSPTWGVWQSPATPIYAVPISVHQHQESDPCNGDLGSLQDYYKPTEDKNCKMEDTGPQFCWVCKEQLVYRIWDEVKAVNEDFDLDPLQNTSITPFDAASDLTFEITNMIEPMPSHMEVRWFFNGTEVSGSADYANGADPGVTEYKWTFDCSLLNGLTEGSVYTVEAKILDRTGSTGNELIRKDTHDDDHEEVYTWYVKNVGESADLWMRDHDDDDGAQPWSPFGWFFDESPDIKVNPDQQTVAFDLIPHESPVVDETNYIYVQIHNKGCETSLATTPLEVFTTINGSFTSWEDGNWDGSNSFGYEITSTTIPAIVGGESETVEISWTTQELSTQPNWESCLLARIGVEGTNDPDDILEQSNIRDWVWQNNNIAMHNVTVVNMFGPDVVELDARPYPGGWTYFGNNTEGSEDFTLELTLDDSKEELHNEAEIVLHFEENGFDISAAINDTNLVGLERIDSTLFRVTSATAKVKNITIAKDTLIPVFVGFGFLTQQVSDTLKYRYHLGQYISSEPDTLLSGQHFWIDRVSRTLFTADAGNDITILSGDTTKLQADDIGEDALYFWLNSNGDTLKTGDEMDVWPTANTTYTLEVIAEADGYKDYDDVTVTVTNGLITSVAPNPASSTTTVDYETTGVTTVKLKVVEVATAQEVDNFTVTAGVGSKVITVSGYNSGAHIITLEGDGADLDTATLMVQ